MKKTYCTNSGAVSLHRSFGHGLHGLDTDKKDIYLIIYKKSVQIRVKSVQSVSEKYWLQPALN